MKPKISIIIPVYNSEIYMRETLDSIVNQTLKDIEIICVDDCSTDNSYQILQEYSKNDSRFVIIQHKSNQGPGIARNSALDVVSGEYIMYVDTDDILELNACEQLYNKINENKSQITFFNFYYYNNDTNKTWFNTVYAPSLKELENKGNLNVRNSYIPYITYLWCKIYSTDFIKENNFRFGEMLMCEDIQFTVETTLKADKISFLNKYLYYYRRYNDNDKTRLVVFNERLKQYEGTFNVRRKVYDYIINYKDSGSYKSTYIIYFINSNINRYKYLYPKISRKEQKYLYKRVKKDFKTVSADFNVLEIKEQIDYKTFKRFIESPNLFFFNCSEYINRIFNIKKK